MYKSARLEVIVFETEDVINTSCGISSTSTETIVPTAITDVAR